jgi:hypothetical protein
MDTVRALRMTLLDFIGWEGNKRVAAPIKPLNNSCINPADYLYILCA